MGLCVAAFLAIAAGFRAMIWSHLPGVFRSPEEDLSHGWIVPCFTLYFLWNERKAIAESLGAPSVRGLLACVPCLLVGFLGARGLQVRFELLAFVGLLITVPWAMFGWRTAERLVFPAAFLLFCMPLNSYLSLVTVHLRILVSAVSSSLLALFGMDIVRQGNLIELPGVIVGGKPFGVDIADPCSGLRSIFALMAVGAGYAYYNQPTWKRRAVLFAFAIPFAVVGNVCRIMAICIVARFSSSGFATLFIHDFAGFVVFLVAVGLFVLASAAMTRVCAALAARRPSASAAPEPAEEGAPAPAGDGKTTLSVPVATLLLVSGAMAFQTLMPEPRMEEAAAVALPVRVRAAGMTFSGTDVEPSVAETNVLVGATISKKAYSHPVEGHDEPPVWFNVSAVVSGPNKMSLHRPELCLPSQGVDVGRDWTLEADGVEWHVIELKAKGGMGAALFAYTFFNQAGFRTSSHEVRIMRDVWDRSALSRIDRWTMVTVQLHLPSEPLLKSVLSSLKEVIR